MRHGICKSTFWGYRRENGRVGVRNHVIILPVDDLSNAAAEAVANNIKGTLAIPHPYGRLQFGADLDLHFRTLIGAGSNPNVAAVVVIGIEDGWTKKVVDGIAATGKPVRASASSCHGDHDTIMRASKAAREYLQWASEKQRVECALNELWVSTKCGESDTTSGCGANPTVGNAFDKLYAAGCTLVFGETTELTGGEQIVAARCRDDKVRAEFMRMFDRYQEVINRHKTSRPVRLAADQGQHRRRPDDDRGKGARQHPEDRQEVHGRRRARQGRDADRHPGLWFMDCSSRGGRDGHAVRGLGLRRPLLPDRAGQRHRQPDPAGDQDLRQPAHGAHDERAHRRRHVGPAAARDHDDEAGDKLLDMMFRTANGRLTAAEALGHREFVLTRLYESA